MDEPSSKQPRTLVNSTKSIDVLSEADSDSIEVNEMPQDDVFIFVLDVRFVYQLCIICTVIVFSSNLYLLIALNKLWLLHSFYLLIPEYEQRVARGGGCSEHPEVSFAVRHNSIKAHFFAVKRTLFYSKKMTLNDNH